MPVEIISIGSEYVLQQHRDSGVVAISNRLIEIGVDVDYISSVIGQEFRLEEVLRQAIERSSLIFVISGVSSGEYDVAKKLLTRVLKKRLVFNYRVLDQIKEQFKRRGEEMPRSAEKRALVPTEAEILENELGDVPGFLFSQEESHVVLFPGDERELDAMFKKHIIPRLDAKTFRLGNVKTVVLKTCGLPSSTVKEWLKNVERQFQMQMFNYIADGEETSVIVTVKSDIQGDLNTKLDEIEYQIRKKLGKYIYGKGSQTLEEVVGILLKEKKQTLALAESCTGGLIASNLTNIPGSSEYFDRGVVSYSNASKISLLDVSPNIIEQHGAVSEETAIAMAEGVRWLAQTSYGLSVTGIAGPGGGTAEKPVGLVYIALASERAKTVCRKHKFFGDRRMIRTRAAQTALDLLRQQLLSEEGKWV